MGYQEIPAELREQRAWVNVWNGGKIPMQSTQRKGASASNPATWSTFDDATAAVENGHYDGIGYVFHDTGVVGIDIDDGYDPDGFLTNLAIDIMGKCKSYTEKSRSGRGVHIIVRGNLPFKGKNNRAGVEIYKDARYFIMTGHQLIYTEIVENQAAIDYVVENYFAESERESTGVQTSRIYNQIWHKPENGVIPLRPAYPKIAPGGRNISLTSLAGALHNQGYDKGDIYRELLHANQTACDPPLPTSEVEMIVNSVTRYQR